MTPEQILKSEFDGERGSFLLTARCELSWDRDAFRRLTSAMYDVAERTHQEKAIPQWIAHGFWFCDTWIKQWTSPPDFPRPDEVYYQESCELIHDLSCFLFLGESPYEDDTLHELAKGLGIASGQR